MSNKEPDTFLERIVSRMYDFIPAPRNIALYHRENSYVRTISLGVYAVAWFSSLFIYPMYWMGYVAMILFVISFLLHGFNKTIKRWVSKWLLFWR